MVTLRAVVPKPGFVTDTRRTPGLTRMRRLHGQDADGDVVDRDLRGVDVGDDFDVSDAPFELADFRLYLGAPLGGHVARAFVQVLAKGFERVDVVVQLVVHLRDVVEDAVRGGQLVSLAELGERRVEAPLFEELHALLKALSSLVHGLADRRRPARRATASASMDHASGESARQSGTSAMRAFMESTDPFRRSGAAAWRAIA